MTALQLGPDIVELVPCPATRRPAGALREMAFRSDSWTPAETDSLRALFDDDRSIDEIAATMG
ncbi:MAG: hypothetical protein F9K41_16990, partial [Sphingopyxis terrae]